MKWKFDPSTCKYVNDPGRLMQWPTLYKIHEAQRTDYARAYRAADPNIPYNPETNEKRVYYRIWDDSQGRMVDAPQYGIMFPAPEDRDYDASLANPYMWKEVDAAPAGGKDLSASAPLLLARLNLGARKLKPEDLEEAQVEEIYMGDYLVLSSGKFATPMYPDMPEHIPLYQMATGWRSS